MSHHFSIDRPIMELISDNVDGIIILDVAHGRGSWGYQIKTKKKGRPILIGLDLWIPHVAVLNQKKIYDELIICDARNPPFRSRSIDIVMACEVLEHMSMEEGDSFLKRLETLYRNLLIVSTPQGHYEQNTVYGNTLEQHLSGWKEKDFQQRKYKIKTVLMSLFPPDLHLLRKVGRIFLQLLRGKQTTTHLIIAWKNYVGM